MPGRTGLQMFGPLQRFFQNDPIGALQIRDDEQRKAQQRRHCDRGAEDQRLDVPGPLVQHPEHPVSQEGDQSAATRGTEMPVFQAVK